MLLLNDKQHTIRHQCMIICMTPESYRPTLVTTHVLLEVWEQPHTSIPAGWSALQVDAGFDEHAIPYDVIWLDIEHTNGKR